MTFHPKGLLIFALFAAALLLAVNARLGLVDARLGIAVCVVAALAYASIDLGPVLWARARRNRS